MYDPANEYETLAQKCARRNIATPIGTFDVTPECRNTIEAEPVDFAQRVKLYQYADRMALGEARALMAQGCEPTSAYKQAASDAGIEYGDAMGEFVEWARRQP